jgi:hypothetical protein
MLRWGIILDRQLLFATNIEEVARRFMALGGKFQVIDHSTGYYAYMDTQRSDQVDLMPEQEIEELRRRS